MLKSRFLLLEGRNENHVKMHDVVRDVAIFIASEEKRINCNDCTWISHNIGERIVGSIFPNLHLLWIGRESRDKELEMQDDFFNGMRELNVLSIIECRSLRQLPQTTELLKNLRTLVLYGCGSLESISVVGELVNLEILICRWCDSIESLPIEMGRLSGLRLLELSHCENLKTIAPGIITNQKGLEELIGEEFDGWEADSEEGERKNASLSEVNGLPNLTRLKIKIKDYRLGAEQIRLSPNIAKYDIAIGGYVRRYDEEGFEKKIVVELPVNITLGNWIHECVRSVEHLNVSGDGSRNLDFGSAQKMRLLSFHECSTVKKLVSMKTTSTVFPLLEHLELEELSELVEICDSDGPMQSNSFNNLKELRLWRLPALEHLWKTSITPYDQHNVVSIFNKLSSIYIYKCDKLRSLFSSSMMTRGSCLVQLERLEIKICGMMEQVVLWDEEVNQSNNPPITLVFPKLKYLKLFSLPRLSSFSKGIESTEFPELEKMTVKKCPVLKSIVLTPDSIHLFCKLDKVKFGCLKVVKLEVAEYDEMRRNCCPQIPIDLFGGVCELKVSGFKGLKSLFSLSFTESGCLLMLEKLEIIKCDTMEQILLWNEEENQTDIDITQLFPNLKLLTLSHLPSLTSFCRGIQGIGFPLLENLKIYKCPLLKSFVSTASPDDHDDGLLFCKPDKVIFGCLKILTLHGNEMMANLCPFDALFAELRELKVSKFESMKSLLSLSTTTTSGCLSQLEKLEIESCNMMEQVVFLRNEEENQRSIHIPLIFPKLKFLTLESLPRLASFSKGIKSAEFPLLEKIKVRDCPLLKSFVSTGSTDDHDDGDDDSIHLFCQLGKVKFGCLSKMEVHDMMRRNWCPQIPFHFFAGLCEIKVSGFKGLKSLFSLSTTQSGCVLQLEKLEIIKCDMMEQVIFWKEEENQTDIDIITRLVFPKLKLLSLYHLPRLTSLSKLGIQSIQFLLPPQMNIWNCPLLESCVPTTHHNADADADADADDNDDSILLFCKPNKAETNDLPTSSRLIYV